MKMFYESLVFDAVNKVWKSTGPYRANWPSRKNHKARMMAKKNARRLQAGR